MDDSMNSVAVPSGFDSVTMHSVLASAEEARPRYLDVVAFMYSRGRVGKRGFPGVRSS